MNVPRSWLEALVGPLPATEEVVDLLDGLGLAVEQVVERPAIPDGVVLAEIVEATPVEASDHLIRAVVDDGTQRRTVVSGAPNTTVGLRTALATPGTYLPAADLTVEARELRGVPSDGMLCSPRELGAYDDARGLAAFADDLPLGTPLADVWPAETVFELELTPNRADAFGVLGVARDLAAKLGRELAHPAAADRPGDDAGDDGLAVVVEDPAAAPHVALQRIDGVRVGPSPAWLQHRLAALGLRPRTNVVDVTNYVTHELGQPSHAYDLRVLQDGVLEVRPARSGERVALLDGDTYDLDPADLVIATPDGAGGSTPVGLAGVMGGLHDSVRDDTTAVALEVAHFDPVRIRASAKRHGLHTDAHLRFERGVDPALPPLAAAYTARRIAEVAGGTVHPALSRVGGAPAPGAIRFRPSRVPFLMAFDVPPATQRTYLEALGCTVDAQEDDAWTVTPPTWRFDLGIEEDLVEEVGRLHGYEHIGATRPDLAFTPRRTDPTHRALREELAHEGFHEVIHYVFTGDEALARARAPEATVALANPQGVERSRLRTALYPGLLDAAAGNPQAPSLALFEVGRVFLEPERERVAWLLAGAYARDGWTPDTPVAWPHVAGLLERLAARRRADLTLRPADPDDVPMLHPGVAARVAWNGVDVGFAGRVHPEVADAYGLDGAFVAELDLPLAARRLAVADVARQPYAERDLAVVAPDDVPYADLETLVRGAAGDRLVEVFPFDVYAGAPLADGERSVAIRMRWRHPERALRDEEVDADLANVVAAVRAAGHSIREG